MRRTPRWATRVARCDQAEACQQTPGFHGGVCHQRGVSLLRLDLSLTLRIGRCNRCSWPGGSVAFGAGLGRAPTARSRTAARGLITRCARKRKTLRPRGLGGFEGSCSNAAVVVVQSHAAVEQLCHPSSSWALEGQSAQGFNAAKPTQSCCAAASRLRVKRCALLVVPSTNQGDGASRRFVLLF